MTKDAPKQTEILGWWKEKTMWPKLQLMARQYLAVPATSAGVERLFSKASLVYDDLALGCVIGCVTGYQVIRVIRIFAITYPFE